MLNCRFESWCHLFPIPFTTKSAPVLKLWICFRNGEEKRHGVNELFLFIKTDFLRVGLKYMTDLKKTNYCERPFKLWLYGYYNLVRYDYILSYYYAEKYKCQMWLFSNYYELQSLFTYTVRSVHYTVACVLTEGNRGSFIYLYRICF